MVLVVKPGEFDSGVVSLENLLDREALARQAVGADLTHPYAAPPAPPGNNEPGDATAFAVCPIDDKELFAQAERRPNASAAHVAGALRTNYFQINYPARRA